MASYYNNPYNLYPASYANQMGYSGMAMPQVQPPVMQQNMPQQPQLKAMEWVEGEIGAKAFQMPVGWPANQPIPLWDSTDTVIWLKSWGPMGIPNPLLRIPYENPQQQNQMFLGNGQSGATEPANPQPDMSNYATKDDIDSLREEVRMLRQHNNQRNQNGSATTVQQNQNRGGNQ